MLCQSQITLHPQVKKCTIFEPLQILFYSIIKINKCIVVKSTW